MVGQKTKTALFSVAIACAVIVLFQNCSPVHVEPVAGTSSYNSSGGYDPYGNDPYGSSYDDPYGNDPYGNGGNNEVSHKFTFTPDRRVDIILVVDNSASMKNDYPKLTAGLSNFVKSLQEDLKIDWQMCAITTDMSGMNANTNGQALNWYGLNKRVFSINDVKNRTPQAVADIFNKTLNQYLPIQNAGDERGIAALSKNVDLRTSNGCYRAGSTVAPIIISDEDVRSWGGVRAVYDEELAFVKAVNVQRERENLPLFELPNIANLPLQDIDKPDIYIAKMISLGVKKLIVNSIVVKDAACKAKQEEPFTFVNEENKTVTANFKAFIGSVYMSLSQKTGVQPNSICDSDYSNNLLNFADKIEASSFEYTLKCIPKAGTFSIDAGGLVSPRDYTASLNGQTVTVASPSKSPFDFVAKYVCQ